MDAEVKYGIFALRRVSASTALVALINYSFFDYILVFLRNDIFMLSDILIKTV